MQGITLTSHITLTRLVRTLKELAVVCDITDLQEWKKKKAEMARPVPPVDPLMDIAMAVSNQGRVLREMMSKDRFVVDFLKELAKCQYRTIDQLERMLDAVASVMLRVDALEKQQQMTEPSNSEDHSQDSSHNSHVDKDDTSSEHPLR